MSSFISSFKHIFLTAFIVFVTYNIFVVAFKPVPSLYQDRRVFNLVKAERFIYENIKGGTLIVGSSMANRLVSEFLPENATNLALTGGTPLTGLDIILKIDAAPDLVLIEINTLSRLIDKTLIEDLLGEPMHSFRRFLPSMRHEYRPVNLILSALFGKLSFMQEHAQAAFLQDEQICAKLLTSGPTHDVINPARRKASLVSAIERGRKYVDIQNQLNQLSDFITKLTAKGVRVSFFEMPVHPSLVDLPAQTNLRRTLLNMFPEIHIIRDDTKLYTTSDGIHLPTNSAKRFACYLFSETK